MSTLIYGKYFDRIVTIQDVENFCDIEFTHINNAAVLLWLGENKWQSEKFSDFIKRLFEHEPIAIGVSGMNAEEQFDILIKIQSYITSEKHTMTHIYDEENIEEVLDYFFLGTFTDDERWDNWDKYHIIVINDINTRTEIVELLKSKWLKAVK